MTNTPDMSALVVYKEDEQTLIATAARLKGLKVASVTDVAGYTKCRDGRLLLRKQRISIENTRKDLKASALDFGRKVDAEAKRLTAMIEPTELALESEENWYVEENERLKRQAEQKRLDALEAARKAEAARLAAEKKKLDDDRRALEEEKAQLARERQALDAAKTPPPAIEYHPPTEMKLVQYSDNKPPPLPPRFAQPSALNPNEGVETVGGRVVPVPLPTTQAAPVPTKMLYQRDGLEISHNSTSGLMWVAFKAEGKVAAFPVDSRETQRTLTAWISAAHLKAAPAAGMPSTRPVTTQEGGVSPA